MVNIPYGEVVSGPGTENQSIVRCVTRRSQSWSSTVVTHDWRARRYDADAGPEKLLDRARGCFVDNSANVLAKHRIPYHEYESTQSSIAIPSVLPCELIMSWC